LKKWSIHTGSQTNSKKVDNATGSVAEEFADSTTQFENLLTLMKTLLKQSQHQSTHFNLFSDNP